MIGTPQQLPLNWLSCFLFLNRYMIMDIMDYYEIVTSKICKLESMNEGLVLIAPEQEVNEVRSLMVGVYVPEHERYKMYTFRSSMNEGELGDKFKAMVGTMDALKPDWDRIKKERRKRV